MDIENVMDTMIKEAKTASFYRGMKWGAAIASISAIALNTFVILYDRKLQKEEEVSVE